MFKCTVRSDSMATAFTESAMLHSDWFGVQT